MGRFFSAMERKIIEKVEEVGRAALKSAAKELQEDIYDNICYKVVEDYYEEYTPSKYKRTHDLYNAWAISSEIGGDDRIHFLPILDSDLMSQHYSRSRFHKEPSDDGKWRDYYSRTDDEDNGLPDNDWILKNFFEGIHPRFYLNKQLGVVIDASYQFPGVLSNMSKHIAVYKRSGRMVSILAKHLKQACKSYM